MSNRFFYSAILVSLIIHLAVIVVLSAERAKLRTKRMKSPEIVYQQIHVTKPKPKEEVKAPIKIEKKEEIKTKNVEILSKKSRDFSPMQDSSKLSPKLIKDINQDKKILPSPNNIMKERKIEVPLLKSEKITNPKYLNYNDTIRYRIKQRAIEMVEELKLHPGDVYLTFVLKSDGTLLQAKIIEERSNADSYLKKLGLRIIQESGPFTPFPKDLSYPELTFNIIISFK